MTTTACATEMPEGFMYPTSVQFDIELFIDADALIGEKPDPDKIASRVKQYHPKARLFELRAMVLDTLPSAEPDSAYCPPWGN